MNKEYADLLWYWIRERELIRTRRASGLPPPWTKDRILNYYHFCNVRRQHDRGTIEIQKVVRLNKVLVNDLPWAFTIGRMLNKAESLDVVLRDKLFGWETLKKMREAGETVFHTAYVVSTCGKKMDKLDYVRQVSDRVRCLQVPRTTLADAHGVLMSVDGLGNFLAGQVVADLKNTGYLEFATDWFDWACPGPGSLKGMEIIFGHRTTVQGFPAHMRHLRESMPRDIELMNIHGQDLQNCLCEFSKYVRYLENRPGRSRPYHGQ